jgi:ABC-type antimicrobial peptide transport system permease subunit
VAGLTTAFSTLSLALAGLGIFGVTAYAVAQRRREFGIRLALGAQRRHVRTLVLARVAVVATAGVGIGGGIGLTIGSIASGLLFGVEPLDLPTLVGTGLAIAATAVLASLAPLRTAVRVNLTDVLRAE